MIRDLRSAVGIEVRLAGHDNHICTFAPNDNLGGSLRRTAGLMNPSMTLYKIYTSVESTSGSNVARDRHTQHFNHPQLI